MSAKRRRAVFLDRDGTLNQSPGEGWILRPEDLKLIEGVPAALRRLFRAGYLLIVISNQRAVSLGKLTLEDLERINAKLKRALESEGVALEAIYCCPHGDEDGCGCRKPLPGMILTAAEKHGIDLSRSWMVGDRPIDGLTGLAAGVRPVIVDSYGEEAVLLNHADVPTFALLSEAVTFIIGDGDKPRR